MGVSFSVRYPDFAMGATIGFNQSIPETKWRWGIDVGLMNQGILDYVFDADEPDRFVRPNYEYIGGFVDYSLFSRDYLAVFARGGLAPAHRSDLFVHHREDSYTCLCQVGIGADFLFNRFIINGYIDPRGSFVLLFSYGWWFGKKSKPRG